MYTNTLINITKKRKSKAVVNNTEYHDTRGNGLAPAGGSQIEDYRIYNTEIVPTVQGFNKYIKAHGHVMHLLYQMVKFHMWEQLTGIMEQ